MIDRGDRICVAISGGPDSVALLQFLSLLAGDYELRLVAAHVNHGLRGKESDRDELFVKELGASMAIPVKCTYVSIKEIKKKEGGSIENICRRERFKFLKELSRKEGLNKIALGHNLNDQAETIIMRFLRGSGVEGLKGMLPLRDERYIRPFLEVTRDEILAFLKNEGMQYVTDSSNMERVYVRNRIRRDLIPELRDSYNDRLVENLGQMADILREEDDYFESIVERTLKNWEIHLHGDAVRITISQFKSLHIAMQRRVIKYLLERLSSKTMGIGYVHVMAVVNLINGNRSNGSLDLPFCMKIEREYDTLILSKAKDESALRAASFTYDVKIPGIIDIREADMRIKIDLVDGEDNDFTDDRAIYMDYNAIALPLEIRNVKEGERMQPLGMEGTKKIKEIFIDEKIPKKRRSRIPLLVDRKSVLWIMGVKMSDRVRLTNTTEKVVKAEII